MLTDYLLSLLNRPLGDLNAQELYDLVHFLAVKSHQAAIDIQMRFGRTTTVQTQLWSCEV